jgi:hypothetical protein
MGLYNEIIMIHTSKPGAKLKKIKGIIAKPLNYLIFLASGHLFYTMEA